MLLRKNSKYGLWNTKHKKGQGQCLSTKCASKKVKSKPSPSICDQVNNNKTSPSICDQVNNNKNIIWSFCQDWGCIVFALVAYTCIMKRLCEVLLNQCDTQNYLCSRKRYLWWRVYIICHSPLHASCGVMFSSSNFFTKYSVALVHSDNRFRSMSLGLVGTSLVNIKYNSTPTEYMSLLL